MSLYILKPIFWNNDKYRKPSGVQASSGFPDEHGYGHEEWNNSPKMDFENEGIPYRAFHTEGLGEGLAEQHNGRIFVFMYASHDGIQQLVGIAGNAIFLTDDSKRKNLAKTLKVQKFANDAWSLEHVKNKYNGNKKLFNKEWKRNTNWIPNWVCRAENLLWFENPITLDANELTGKAKLLTMYSSHKVIDERVAKNIMELVPRENRRDSWKKVWEQIGTEDKGIPTDINIAKTTVNPKWSRDELIVVLDLYRRTYPNIPIKTSSDVIEMSEFLGQLRTKLSKKGNEKFRNVNGVYMKMMNFHNVNPEYTGVGLASGGKLDQEIWDEFYTNPKGLKKTSKAIREAIESSDPLPSQSEDDDIEQETQEGQILTRLHRYRERNAKIIKKKKQQALKNSRTLECEGCGFSFLETYGSRGDGFIECHHTKPISEMKPGEKTSLKDLALVCSNCHRMIHKKRPWLSVAELKIILSTSK